MFSPIAFITQDLRARINLFYVSQTRENLILQKMNARTYKTRNWNLFRVDLSTRRPNSVILVAKWLFSAPNLILYRFGHWSPKKNHHQRLKKHREKRHGWMGTEESRNLALVSSSASEKKRWWIVSAFLHFAFFVVVGNLSGEKRENKTQWLSSALSNGNNRFISDIETLTNLFFGFMVNELITEFMWNRGKHRSRISG